RKIKLSVTLATKNEEANIARCLNSVKDIADEIVIFDEHSNDDTVKIAKSFGAKVFDTDHEPIFHITKEKANKKACGDWILQLDADECVSEELAWEIKSILDGKHDQFIAKHINSKLKKYKDRLFYQHQENINKRDGRRDSDGEVVAYYLPRKNMFLGKPITYAGVYPDGVIRLFKKGKAYLPGESVHEQMKVNGRVSWCYFDLLHYDSPTFERYLYRANRYTDLTAMKFKSQNVSVSLWNLLYYSFVKPTLFFVKLYFRHLGFRDGMRGFIWSFFSALHFPIAYFKYYSEVKKDLELKKF
ncbi:MAG: glycosyltransferase family 2 protein, partial [Patescibacteria group bacterium]|nr:glycosyltransferase family 2 protein [Patescibacteria group bacterium]